jgi:hypothetical protein
MRQPDYALHDRQHFYDYTEIIFIPKTYLAPIYGGGECRLDDTAYQQKRETGRIPSLFFLAPPWPKVRGGTSCASWQCVLLDYLAGVAGVAGVAGSAAAGLAAFSALAFL